MVMVCAIGMSFAQRTVTGTVTDSKQGEPLIGASVVVEGTAAGTVTDIDGNFTLEVPEDANTLVISYTGYSPKEVVLGTSNVVNVELTPGITLTDVVVTAMGISREKKTLGYAVQELDGDEVNEVRETNFVSSLSGKVSGVHIRQPNTMGGSANILIRGITSLTQDNQALFVVDGVPIDNTNTNESRPAANESTAQQNDGWGGYDYGNAAMDINPDDIESISVLKGAAASALYGSRAANGVILVTTKKGTQREGIGVTINSGFQASSIDRSTMPKHQRQYGGGYGPFYEDPTALFFYADIDGDGVEDLIAPTSEDASWGAEFDPNLMVIHWDALDPLQDNYGEKRPWVVGANGIDYFFRTGTKFTNNIALEGGNDFGTFRLSYTNMQQTGILPNSSMDRNSFNFASTYNLTDRFNVEANMSYVHTEAIGRYGTGYDGLNVMQSFGQWIQTNVDFARLEQKYLRPDGSQLSWNHSYYNDLHPIYFDNPYWTRKKNFEDDERNRVFGHGSLNYELTDWLTLTGRVALDYYDESQNERIAIGSVDQSYFSNFSRTNRDINTDIFARFNLAYDEWSFTGMLGANFRQYRLEQTLGETVGGLIVPGLYSVSNSVSPKDITENLVRIGTNSLMGNVSIGWKDMIYLDISDRYDISSTLPDEHNDYNYYGVSASFILSELPALRNSSWLPFAKIRASYAEVGNDAPAYSTISTYSQGTSWGDLALFSVNSTLQNPELKPERSKSVEVGLTANMFQNRFGFDVAYYKTNSEDQIMPVLVSRASGYARRFVNGGEIENRGVEVSLTGTPVKTQDFTWDIGVNWYKNENEVISLYGDVQNLLLYSAWDVSINAAVGEPYGTIKGTDFMYTNGQRTVGEDGYYLYALDEDGQQVEDAVIGDINPDWNMGLSSRFTYKGISLKVLFDIQKGGDIYSINTKYGQATGVYAETAGLNDKGNPIRDRVADGGGYLYPNTVYQDGSPNTTYVEAYRWGRAFYYNNSPTARYVFDASYTKLRELSLAYSLPSSVIANTPFTDVTVSLIGRNLWIIDKNVRHFDPEFALSSGNQQGIETGSYPTTKTFGVNLKVGF